MKLLNKSIFKETTLTMKLSFVKNTLYNYIISPFLI